jgi:hypothetical protein
MRNPRLITGGSLLVRGLSLDCLQISGDLIESSGTSVAELLCHSDAIHKGIYS